MYIFHNAVRNIMRNKGRNILLGSIVLVIIAATVVSLIINNTSGKIIDNYKAQFGSKVSLTPDMEQMYSQGKDFNRVTPEQFVEFAKSDYLQSTTFSKEIPSISQTLKAVDQDANSSSGGKMMFRGPDGEAQENPTMKLVGSSSVESLTEFIDGQREIESGGMYAAPNECVVSKEFAELNNISVGDKISVSSIFGVPFELTVTGIYFDATQDYSMPMRMSFLNRRNEILTSFDTVMTEDTKNAGSVNATYYLKDPDLLPDFAAELREKGLPDTYTVSTDDASYQKVVGPVKAMKGIFLTFMLVVLILGSIILILLSSIAIRERKYEIGVLRAMGMKKGKVALGLITETLVITVVCLVVGLGVGGLLSQPTASAILTNQVKTAEENKAANGPGKFLMVAGVTNQNSSSATPLSEIEVELDAGTLIEITLIALLLAALASSMSISRITKYEPIKILMERN